MAKWETEIYHGELAQEIRSEYRKLLAVKKSDSEAEQLVVDYWTNHVTPGSNDEGHMWLALALCQWELGRLSAAVKEKAIYWLRRPVEGISKDAMDMLEITLHSSMPKKKHVPLPAWVAKCPWPAGSLLAYRIISHENGKVRNSPYWEKYVLLRVIMIKRKPVAMLAPDAGWSESMLVGLYNWCGNTIPDASIVDRLEFTPISVIDASLSKAVINRIYQASTMDISIDKYKTVVKQLAEPRVETCCCLDWHCAKNIDSRKVFTYMGCDTTFQPSDFFKTETTQYSFAHSIPFDAMLFNRLKQLEW